MAILEYMFSEDIMPSVKPKDEFSDISQRVAIYLSDVVQRHQPLCDFFERYRR